MSVQFRLRLISAYWSSLVAMLVNVIEFCFPYTTQLQGPENYCVATGLAFLFDASGLTMPFQQSIMF